MSNHVCCFLFHTTLLSVTFQWKPTCDTGLTKVNIESDTLSMTWVRTEMKMWKQSLVKSARMSQYQSRKRKYQHIWDPEKRLRARAKEKRHGKRAHSCHSAPQLPSGHFHWPLCLSGTLIVKHLLRVDIVQRMVPGTSLNPTAQDPGSHTLLLLNDICWKPIHLVYFQLKYSNEKICLACAGL